MGGTGSTADQSSAALGKNDEEIVLLMMPVFYNAEVLSKEEHKLATECWQAVLNNSAPGFLQKKKSDPNFKFPTAILYFYDCFYSRLFDIHPLARDLFKDAKSQGKFLVKMISLSLSEMADVVKFEKTLVKLAEIHNERGVKAIEYGVVGEVLFWAIREVAGPEVYTFEVHQAWVKIYSRMLKTMVPVAVAHELKDGSAQEKRFFGDTIGLSAAEEQVLNGMSGEGNSSGGFSGSIHDIAA